jgi:hypothetical protein
MKFCVVCISCTHGNIGPCLQLDEAPVCANLQYSACLSLYHIPATVASLHNSPFCNTLRFCRAEAAPAAHTQLYIALRTTISARCCHLKLCAAYIMLLLPAVCLLAGK